MTTVTLRASQNHTTTDLTKAAKSTTTGFLATINPEITILRVAA